MPEKITERTETFKNLYVYLKEEFPEILEILVRDPNDGEIQLVLFQKWVKDSGLYDILLAENFFEKVVPKPVNLGDMLFLIMLWILDEVNKDKLKFLQL